MTVTSSPYLLRPMTVADIPRVSEVERESFPTMWPQTAYKRELQRNNLAAYLVLSRRSLPGEPARTAEAIGQLQQEEAAPASPLARLGRGVRRLFGANEPAPVVLDAPPEELILGFVGIWFMVDEAHIVTIAVAEAERRQGLGEMLLIAAIELAQRREASVVTLEVRVSNIAAQALYEKYAFRQVGVRKRYYTDNNEDALIMTTLPIQSGAYRARFQELRAAHAARRGVPQVEHPEL